MVGRISAIVPLPRDKFLASLLKNHSLTRQLFLSSPICPVSPVRLRFALHGGQRLYESIKLEIIQPEHPNVFALAL